MEKIRWDRDKLRGVIENAALYNLDLSRGRIEADPSRGFWVHIDQPLFGGLHGYAHEAKIHCTDASVAEGELLRGLYAMQKAERIAARTGASHANGRDSVWITRTPLTASEISDHRARVKHATAVKRYADELTHVLDKNRRQAKDSAGVKHLTETYGISVPVAAMPASTTDKTREAPNARLPRGNRK